MSKKYYWPTSWDNLGIVLTNGYIAPENVYSQMLADGVTINLANYSQSRSTITLFGELPDVHIGGNENLITDAVIIEISEECINLTQLSSKDGQKTVYTYLQPIFFNSSNIRVIFYSTQAKERSIARLTSAAEIKDLDSYQKGFIVDTKPNKRYEVTNLHGLFTEIDSKFSESNELVRGIRLIDSAKGTYIGLLAGLFFQKSNSERDIFGLLQEIKNKYAGAKSDQIMRSDHYSTQTDTRLSNETRNFAELIELIGRLSDQIEHWEFGNYTMARLLDLQQRIRLSKNYSDKLDIQIKKYLKVFRKHFEINELQEKAIAYFLKSPVEWLFADELIQAPHFLEEVNVLIGPEWVENKRKIAIDQMKTEPVFIAYKLRNMLKGNVVNVFSRDGENEFNSMIENLQSFVEKSLNRINKEKFKEINLRDFEFILQDSQNYNTLLTNDEYEYKAWQLITEELRKEAAKRTNIGIKNNGWQYEERIDFINNLINSFKSQTNLENFIADLKTVQSSLESHFEGTVKIDSIHSSLIANLYAFLFKFKDIDQLDRYLNQKVVERSYYAWCFWATFHGYSSLPKKYIDPLFNCWSKKELEVVYSCMRNIQVEFLR